MNKTIILSLLLFFAIAPSKAVAHNSSIPSPYYYFSRYQVVDGLPGNGVFCVAQDRYGFLWVGTANGICRYDGYHFTTVYDAPSCSSMSGISEAVFVDREGLVWFSTVSAKGFYDPVSGRATAIELESDKPVTSIVQDYAGDIWFCSDDLFRYGKDEKKITRYPSGHYDFISATADSEGQIWCTCSDGRLLVYDRLVDKFKEENIQDFSLIAQASGNRIVASMVDGRIVLFNPSDSSMEVILPTLSESGIINVTSLLERVPGEFWIGTNSGIFIFTEENGKVLHVSHSDGEDMSLSSNDVKCLSTDREGNVWAGTSYNGLNLWRNNDSAYSFFYPIRQEHTISGTVVRAVSATNRRIWVGTEDGEMNYIPFEEPTFYQIALPGYRNNYQDVLSVGDELWISTYGSGIFRYDLKSSSVIRHYQFGTNQFHRQILTSDGSVLVCSTNGIYRYVKESDSFELISGTEGTEALALCEDSEGRIWVGTYGRGIILLDKSFRKTDVLQPEIRVTSLFEDSRHRMWVTTEGDAVFTVDTGDLTTEHLSKEKGFPSSVTCSVAEDSEGMIWISTNNGLHLLDPSDNRIVSSFFRNGDTQSSQFTYGAVCMAGTDTIFMGTSYGLLSFSPSKMKSIKMDKSIYFSSIKGFAGENLTDLCEEGISSLHAERIVTSYKQATSLRIRFSCLNFASPISYRYCYTLSSRRRSISEITNERMALLFNPGYGKHVFTVSLVGSDAPESTKSVEIIIRPPFHKSIFARILMALVLSFLAGFIVFHVIKWRRNERLMRQERIDKEKQRELYESKNAFFMNITHEIRTPLSLIKMPLDHMIKTGQYSEKEMLVIKANTDRLLELTNQLLDIRKFEQNEKKLEFTRCRLSDIVYRTVALFNNMAEDQGVHMRVSIPDPGIEAMCSADSVEKIISNLISNALKYGSDEIMVSMETAADKALIRVDSNGDRIRPKDREKIFEKFYHGGKGTGLGLPLARALAEQHDGKLFLDTSRSDVNSFVVELPLEHPEMIALNLCSSSEGNERQSGEDEQYQDIEKDHKDSRRDILVVEDNEDFRLYLAESLSKEFNVFTAANGKAAVEKIQSMKIDLVISDVMMPVMDGCELCNYVKTTVEYSHIPVILLTAAVGMETRMATLEVGADAYIEKPFPIELLQATVLNLFKNREISYHQFSQSPLSHFNGAPTNKVDEEIMTRLHTVLLEKMSDSALSINDLSSALNISNSTLFRKIKANTGLNISEYIRLSRLKRAAELLASGKYRVNEVADTVGFSSSSYFSSIFQKQFNVSPSEFMKNLNKKSSAN